MTIKLGVVMDPIADINYKKDSTLAMLWAAQARDWQLYYMEQNDLYLEQGVARARMAPLRYFTTRTLVRAGRSRRTWIWPSWTWS